MVSFVPVIFLEDEHSRLFRNAETKTFSESACPFKMYTIADVMRFGIVLDVSLVFKAN